MLNKDKACLLCLLEHDSEAPLVRASENAKRA
jgi:hypothetical protein